MHSAFGDDVEFDGGDGVSVTGWESDGEDAEEEGEVPPPPYKDVVGGETGRRGWWTL